MVATAFLGPVVAALRDWGCCDAEPQGPVVIVGGEACRAFAAQLPDINTVYVSESFYRDVMFDESPYRLPMLPPIVETPMGPWFAPRGRQTRRWLAAWESADDGMVPSRPAPPRPVLTALSAW